MKKYGIIVLLSLISYVQAQQEGNENSSQKTTNNNDKSTPSKDAAQTQKKREDKKEPEKYKSPHTFTGSVSFVSDYRFRGISQTMRRPAVQGTLDYSNANGIYLGTFGSNVDGTSHFYNNTSMEWDFYGGYKVKPLPCSLPDFGYNGGLIYYYYPGGEAHVPERVKYNTGEFFIELSYKWLSIKYSQTITNSFGVNSDNPPTNYNTGHTDRPNGSSRGSTFIEANLTFDLLKKVCYGCLEAGKLNLLLHVGHQTVRHYEHLSYTGWRATLTQEFDWFNLFVTYIGTNARHAYYDVPDNAYHPKKRHLGVQSFIIGVVRSF